MDVSSGVMVALTESPEHGGALLARPWAAPGRNICIWKTFRTARFQCKRCLVVHSELRCPRGANPRLVPTSMSAVRRAHRAGCSLRDVQLLSSHRSIETTQGYVDGDTDGERRLVSLL